jgi:cytochrome b subunit of formate dehydrogenase
MNFKANVGENESLTRLIAGAVIMALAMLVGGFLQWVLMIAGFVLVITGIIRWCPVYCAVKKSTAE